MDVELTDEGYLNITNVAPEQARRIAWALEHSPNREFAEDSALRYLLNGEFEEITGLARNQVSMLAFALRDTPDQSFMEDQDLRKLFKLMAILTSDLFDDMTEGRMDPHQFKPQ